MRREVEYWLAHKSRETILVALTSGDLVWDQAADRLDLTRTNALPPQLADLAVEPLYADFRQVRFLTGRARRRAFRETVVDIAARLHHRSKADMIDEERRLQRRNQLVVSAAAATIAVLGVAAAGFALESRLQQGRADEQARLATARQLITRADLTAPTDPALALKLGLAAHALAPGPETRSAVVGTWSPVPTTGRSSCGSSRTGNRPCGWASRFCVASFR